MNDGAFLRPALVGDDSAVPPSVGVNVLLVSTFTVIVFRLLRVASTAFVQGPLLSVSTIMELRLSNWF